MNFEEYIIVTPNSQANEQTETLTIYENILKNR